jgi:hypothetical protein
VWCVPRHHTGLAPNYTPDGSLPPRRDRGFAPSHSVMRFMVSKICRQPRFRPRETPQCFVMAPQGGKPGQIAELMES